MKRFVLVSSVLLVVLKFGSAQEESGNELYSRRYEQLDVDTVLKSPRLVSNYVECLLNKKPCPPEGKALKRILPEALRTKCAKCWPSQKEGALKVITSLYFKYPHYYKALREKWDSTGEYHRRFEEYLRDQKFNSIGSNGSDSEAGEQAQGSSIDINVTQRPTRQGSQGQTRPPNVAQDEISISNRFGSDDDDNGGYEYETPVTTMKSMSSANRPSSSRATTRPVTTTTIKSTTTITTERPQRPPPPPPRPMSTQSSLTGSSNGNNWNHQGTTTTTFYIKTQNPVLNIINRITMKFANTAEFIAGMLRGNVVSQADDRYGYYQPLVLHRVSINKPPNNRRIIFQKTISF